jgi:hypothetical protein
VRTIRKTVFAAYIAACLAILVLGPLIVLHGYRAWWLDWYYVVLAIAIIGGNISHYRMVRRNRYS